MPRLWRFSELIDTDVLAPGFYMKSPLPELANHCLEAIRPDFASTVGQGDIMLSGPNMGVGSSREQAAEVLKYLGVEAIIAPSFAGIFYRNAINLGLPAFTIPEASLEMLELEDGAEVCFDLDAAELTLVEHDITITLEPLPAFLKEMVLDGGLVQHLEKRFGNAAAEKDII